MLVRISSVQTSPNQIRFDISKKREIHCFYNLIAVTDSTWKICLLTVEWEILTHVCNQRKKKPELSHKCFAVEYQRSFKFKVTHKNICKIFRTLWWRRPFVVQLAKAVFTCKNDSNWLYQNKVTTKWLNQKKVGIYV